MDSFSAQPDAVNIYVWMNENNLVQSNKWTQRYLLFVTILTLFLQLAISIIVAIKSEAPKLYLAFHGLWADEEINKICFCGNFPAKMVSGFFIVVI